MRPNGFDKPQRSLKNLNGLSGVLALGCEHPPEKCSKSGPGVVGVSGIAIDQGSICELMCRPGMDQDDLGMP